MKGYSLIVLATLINIDVDGLRIKVAYLIILLASVTVSVAAPRDECYARKHDRAVGRVILRGDLSANFDLTEKREAEGPLYAGEAFEKAVPSCWTMPPASRLPIWVVGEIIGVKAVGQDHGMSEAEQLVPVIFIVIVGTISIYGLIPPVPWPDGWGFQPSGNLFVGAAPLVRSVAKSLHDGEISVLLVDNNQQYVNADRMPGFAGPLQK
ncbi:MAG: hypothetical protein M2R45_01174 [Verrucomicrobia subdivision 3 bacterium]|nr:hypothetical protein [Limisphaerales bacterium]MCS1415273.1 hypothetical protein [Limisphaerales bacterium]